ncbi:hypothetical protein [Actinomadura parmotrematis]|uniref:Lipoprotein n=1 Tax=Actinomadura parmotrematis TaxID=2864039 RepID=A0ABS7FYX8_9ACTN|nr:hypothetical protein [Actinomadura parmotrematis]MBW8485642.1 hypothetical protein [Actinomadura parmotrematis]
MRTLARIGLVPAALAVPILIMACRPSGAGTAPEASGTPGGGGSFTLAPGGSAAPDGGDVTVTFEGVPADSRCPEGVQCVWEGDATVRVKVSAGGTDAPGELHTSARFAQEIAVHGHRLRLVGLTPAKQADAPVAPDAYRAEFALD